MNKVIVDGEVAVLYSPGWGAGWYTWNNKKELLFDPILVELVAMKINSNPEDVPNIVKQIQDRAYEIEPDGYFGGAEDLDIYWLEENTQFYIDEYDGSESITTRENTKWITA